MGSMILQLARAPGCRASRCTQDAEAEFCRRIGASHVVVTTRTDYVEEVRRLTGGAGATHSFNGVGGDTINRDPRMPALFGELHCYGYVAARFRSISSPPIARSRSRRSTPTTSGHCRVF
jgi:NADPH2:quinone reductase